MALSSPGDAVPADLPALQQAVGPAGRRWYLGGSEDTDPIEGPQGPVGDGEDGGATRGPVAAPRLARHQVTLSDGHRVGVAVSGRGLPLVVVHGFSAEGFLYAQTLSRLVSMGFKVIAIDTAGHGGTQGLPYGGANLEQYTRLLARAIDELGIRRAMLAGHSMGGRLVTQYAASAPDRAIAVLLLDAIVGDTWDRMVDVARFAPGILAGIFVILVADTVSTAPVFGNPRQAAKLGHLLVPTLVDRVRRPWRLIGPAVSILRSRGSRWMLQRIAQEDVPLYAIHGDRDYAVPVSTAASAARHGRGELVVVHGGSHSWLLKDPETLPAIVAELLQGRLGDAYRDSLVDAGLDPEVATFDEIEAAMYEPDAPILALTPELEFRRLEAHHRRPRYRWDVVAP
jgi:pimeloyl-ACP methyl ester carboxylesterase